MLIKLWMLLLCPCFSKGKILWMQIKGFWCVFFLAWLLQCFLGKVESNLLYGLGFIFCTKQKVSFLWEGIFHQPFKKIFKEFAISEENLPGELLTGSAGDATEFCWEENVKQYWRLLSKQNTKGVLNKSKSFDMMGKIHQGNLTHHSAPLLEKNLCFFWRVESPWMFGKGALHVSSQWCVAELGLTQNACLQFPYSI